MLSSADRRAFLHKHSPQIQALTATQAQLQQQLASLQLVGLAYKWRFFLPQKKKNPRLILPDFILIRL